MININLNLDVIEKIVDKILTHVDTQWDRDVRDFCSRSYPVEESINKADSIQKARDARRSK